MKPTTPSKRSRTPLRLGSLRLAAALALAAGTLLPAGLLRADTIVVKSGGGTLPMEGTIQRIENGDLVYTSQSSDRETKKKLDTIWQIKSANEPKLTAAEQAFVEGKYADAATAYQAALNSTQSPWVKTRATFRLIEAAGLSKQFGPQVAAFIELAKLDPVSAKTHQPDLKGVRADDIKANVAAVERAAGSAAKPEVAALLKETAANMYLAIGDTASASRVLGGTAAAPAVGAAGTAVPGTASPAVVATAGTGGASADMVLAKVKVAMADRNYQQVIADLNANKHAFTDPVQQATALWDLAQAKYATAGNDPTALKDAAIAYMRLVAHFDGRPAPLGDQVPAALLMVGEIEEKLKQPAEARQVYEQLANDQKLKGTPVQQKANERLNALKTAG